LLLLDSQLGIATCSRSPLIAVEPALCKRFECAGALSSTDLFNLGATGALLPNKRRRRRDIALRDKQKTKIRTTGIQSSNAPKALRTSTRGGGQWN
jgi:hypothetical protein